MNGHNTKSHIVLFAVTMRYESGRLTEKHYSRLPYNDVTYRYENGRVVEVTDGSGMQNLSYDDLGNISQNIRTFAMPYDNRTYSLALEYPPKSYHLLPFV